MENQNLLANCFFQGRERLYEFERFLCKSLIHSSKQTLWLSAREFKWLFDVAEKRILVNDRTRQPPKVLDSCSSSQIHLWSKCQIVRRRALAEPKSAARRFAQRHAELLVAGETFRPTSRPHLTPPSQTSNLKSTDCPIIGLFTQLIDDAFFCFTPNTATSIPRQ